MCTYDESIDGSGSSVAKKSIRFLAALMALALAAPFAVAEAAGEQDDACNGNLA